MYKKAISLIIISLFVASCGDTLSAVKRGITGEKQKSGDEFLVKKKDPLILPPDFESLPLPDEAIADEEEEILSLEKSFNKRLTESKNPLILSLDSNLQHIIREELVSGNNIFQTLGSAALLMEINSGEILSLISLPDFDLNERMNIEDPIYLNKITKGVYELGSVFKTFTLAAGLESESIKANTVFKDLKNQIICGGMPISEHDKLPKNLTAEEILVRSSNIGAIRIAQKVGVINYKKFLNSLELSLKIQ